MEATELKAELEGIRDALDEKYGAKYAELDGMIRELSQKGSGFGVMPGGNRIETPGAQLIGSEQFKQLANGDTKSARIEVKNTISNLTGSPAEVGDVLAPADRQGLVGGAFRPLNVLDVFPLVQTSSGQVEYTAESSWTSNAAETQEEASKPESDLEFELVSENVRTIAHWTKISRQAMDDAPQVENYVNTRLLHGVRQRLQTQVLKGDGSAPNLKGLDQTGRHTDFTPTTGDTALDSLNRAKYQAVGNDFAINVYILNPSNWGEIERTKRTDDGYVAGESAAVSYIANGAIPMAWGNPVILSNDVASGKFYALDRNAVAIFLRQAAAVEAGYVNTDFTSNLLTLRAELRAGLAVLQSSAVLYGDLTV